MPRPSSDPRSFQPKPPGFLNAALHWAQGTEGAFDPCLGRAVSLWDFENRIRPPDAEMFHRFARRGLFKALELGTSQGQGRGGVPR